MTMRTQGEEGDPRAGSQQSAEAYDQLPYPSLPYPLTHPDRLAVMATLHGMAPLSPTRARVLEIGCAGGGNLLPMAVHLPDSTFLGIDISAKQIGEGQREIEALGLANIALRRVDILDFKADAPFDYIIVHGVMSWIPPATQDHLLQSVRESLAPQGVAYISYNVYPGFSHNRVMRDLMQFHTRDISEPGERARSALQCVGAMADAAERIGSEESERLGSFRRLLEERAERVALLFHEYLEPENHPMYFHEFAHRAATAGLHYISDADPVPHDPANLPDDVTRCIQGWTTDRLQAQQYMDFLHNTRFRRSLLCRDDVVLSPAMSPRAVRQMSLTTQAEELKADPSAAAPERTFAMPTGARLTPTRPMTADLLAYLRECWPADTSAAALADRFPDPDVPEVILSLFRAGFVDLHPRALNCRATIGETPAVTPLVRRQGQHGTFVTNLLHHPVKLDDDTARFLLPLLDGTRDIQALAREMEAAVRDGRLKMEYRGKPLSEYVGLDEILPEFVRFHLTKMVNLALLLR